MFFSSILGFHPDMSSLNCAPECCEKIFKMESLEDFFVLYNCRQNFTIKVSLKKKISLKKFDGKIHEDTCFVTVI